MTQTALDRFWELVFGAIALNPEAFKLIQTLPQSNRVALYILLLAGFSQAIGQGIVLFVNRVKPIRFILSLLIASVLFAFSVGFWGLSTWLVSRILFDDSISFSSVWSAMGLAFAPLIFSFSIALPYLGVPIQILLSIWTLLAFVIGLRVALNLGTWQAFWCAALGWVIFQISGHTIGRPIAAIGKWLSNTAAGTQLVTDMRGLEQLLQTGTWISSGIDPTANKTGDRVDKR